MQGGNEARNQRNSAKRIEGLHQFARTIASPIPQILKVFVNPQRTRCVTLSPYLSLCFLCSGHSRLLVFSRVGEQEDLWWIRNVERGN